MEKKQILIFAGIGVVGLGLVVGTVLFLRSRNAPIQDSDQLAAPPKAQKATGGKAGALPAREAGVRPFTPIESLPVKESWKQGDPPIKIPIQPTSDEMRTSQMAPNP